MSSYWRFSVRLSIFFIAVCLAVAQPGRPPCSLVSQACNLHPHFSPQQAENPHPHDYLFDLGNLAIPLGLPVLSIPASLLIELLLLGLLLSGANVPYLLERKWISPLEPPPPRFSFSS
jgi:hypothetical protein